MKAHVIRPFIISMVLLIASGCTEASSQRIEDYEAARKIFWRSLYSDGGSTLYCQRELGSSYNKGVNIEHVFPMSWVTYSLRCGKRQQCRNSSTEFNRIEADLHNLYPARSDVNKARNNYRFAIITGEARPFSGCDFEYNRRRHMAEPAPAARGKVARSMLYMEAEYDLYLKPALVRLMRDWDHKYPPEADEYQRNDRIEKLQGNRNPYIDHHRQ